jgi:hypothetical protein
MLYAHVHCRHLQRSLEAKGRFLFEEGTRPKAKLSWIGASVYEPELAASDEMATPERAILEW